MPRNVGGGFDELLETLKLTGQQGETAKKRARHLRDVLKAEFELDGEGLLVGSYARQTQIRQSRDIDLLIPLAYGGWAKYGQDSAALINRMRDVLDARYGQTKVSAAGVAVVMDMTDFSLDIVPAFHRQGGGYLIANGQGNWKGTDPTFHLELIREHNSRDSAFRDLVKLIKYWNLKHGGSLRSFHLEMMVDRIWKQGKAEDSLARALQFTLAGLPSLLRSTFPDPWEPAGAIDSYLTQPTRTKVRMQLLEDAARAVTAEQFRLSGDQRAAMGQWVSVFTEGFPAFGGWW